MSSPFSSPEVDRVESELKAATVIAASLLREQDVQIRELNERIKYLEQRLAESDKSASLSLVQRETLPDPLRPPIPDEQWKPHVAVDMGPDTARGESLHDELLKAVYGQNRIKSP